MKYKVEHNVPQNTIANFIITPAQAVFPYTRMKVGDSFQFDRKLARNVGFTSKAFGKNNGMNFITKYSGNKGRCWRTK